MIKLMGTGIAINVMTHDNFSNERADAPAKMTAANASRTKVEVDVGASPSLTHQQAEICTVMHISEFEFLKAQAWQGRGLDQLSDRPIGNGSKVSFGPLASTGFKAR